MSGHNKWSSIKHKKGAQDAKRGKIFSKLIKEITIAAREGGGDPDTNARLRTAVANAKSSNMPNDNITRAIKKGTGEIEGANYEEFTYEAYATNGVALLIKVLTDNKNRTVSEIRSILTKLNGSLASNGSVAWMFNSKGYIEVAQEEAIEEDLLMELSIEAGALDVVKTEDDVYAVYTEFSDLEQVRSFLDSKNISIIKAELIMEPSSTIKMDEAKAESIIKLVEKLEDHDDVQNVFANLEVV
jgi:YebC/PmpR family DNA-binding regulatory protein